MTDPSVALDELVEHHRSALVDLLSHAGVVQSKANALVPLARWDAAERLAKAVVAYFGGLTAVRIAAHDEMLAEAKRVLGEKT